MNLQEAYKILELPLGSSVEDANKQFRKLSKQYHPDNKSTGNEGKFVELNAAHQFITKPETRQGSQPPPDRHSHININDMVFNFNNVRAVEEIKLQLNLSFTESILGCKKSIKYNRSVKCGSCNGEGYSFIKEACNQCQGRGMVTMRQGNMIFSRSCDACGGKKAVKSCDVCFKKGTQTSESEISVTIPGGVSNSTMLRCTNKGNFAGSLGPLDQYMDAFIELNVEEDKELKLVDEFIISNLDISLLEAIRGCNKIVKTVMGNKEINVPARSKNNEEILIPHVGVNGTGNQKVILNVNYPDNTDLLINALSESK